MSSSPDDFYIELHRAKEIMSILREIKQYQKNCPFRRAIVDAIAEHKCCAINDKLDALLGKLEEAELLSRGKPNE